MSKAILPVSRLSRAVLAATSLLLLAPCARAVPLHYELASGSVLANATEPGLVVQTSVKDTLPGTSFTIDNNGSFTFAFFSIWSDEPKIGSDDLISSPVSATLNFLDPLTGSTVSGITVGGSWFKGLSQWGQLTWSGPVTVTVPDRVFQVSLTDATFNYGFGGLNEGTICGAIVNATVTQISSRIPPGNPMPEGGTTVILLGTALAGLRLLSLRRRR